MQIKDHVLLPLASRLADVDAQLAEKISPVLINAIVALIPEAWLIGESPFVDVAAHRLAYVEYLLERVKAPRAFVEEAIRARADLV